MTEAEWLDWRTRGIGASDIAGILNLSPWSSPYSVWASKVLTQTSGGGTLGNAEAMRWGKMLEDPIIDEASRRLDVYAYGRQTKVEHPRFAWARATVDAFCQEGDAEGVIEAKTTGDFKWHEVPVYYEAQVLWQLEVSGREFGWLAALHGGRKLSLWRIERQPELQAAMLDTGREFWETFIVPGIPPPVDGLRGTSEAIDAMHGESASSKTIALDESLVEALAGLRRLRADIHNLEEDRALLENRIKQAMGDAESATIDGREAVTWRTTHSTRIDLEALRQKYPAEAAACKTLSTYRRFIVKDLADSD